MPRLTSRPTARVVWEEGMHLAPHHFQAQRRFTEDTIAVAFDALMPFAYGVSALELDGDALRNGTLAVVHARGLLPDGTPFHMPEADPPPPPRDLAERFSPTRDAHLVYLVLPNWRPDKPNVRSVDAAEDPALRYRAIPRTVSDETSGTDAMRVNFAAKQLRLSLDEELENGEVALPLARVRRDGAGHFIFDPNYVPPSVQIGASQRLTDLLFRVIGMLEAKGQALSETLAPVPSSAGAAAYVGNELATRWLLHAIRSAEGPLRHLLASRRAHPERLWLELAPLAGALCTFSLTTQPRDLPVYDHDDLETCFTAIEQHLRTHLNVVISASAIVVPLARQTSVLFTGNVPDPRCYEPGARWFLGFRSSIGTAQTTVAVPQFVKVCASKFVLELVRRAYNGLAMQHLPSPPAAIAPRSELTYFELTLDGPCAQALRDTREIGAYVPDGLPDAALELAVLVPG